MNATNALRGATFLSVACFSCGLLSNKLANHRWQVCCCHWYRFEGEHGLGRLEPVSVIEMLSRTSWLFDALLTDNRCRKSMEFNGALSADAHGNASIDLTCLIFSSLECMSMRRCQVVTQQKGRHMMTDMIPTR